MNLIELGSRSDRPRADSGRNDLDLSIIVVGVSASLGRYTVMYGTTLKPARQGGCWPRRGQFRASLTQSGWESQRNGSEVKQHGNIMKWWCVEWYGMESIFT